MSLAGRRPHWHWLPLILAVGVILGAGAVVTRLRQDAVRSRTASERLLDVRYLVTDSDRLVWQIVAQGFPNFTFSAQIAGDRTQLLSDLAYLATTGPSTDLGITDVRGWVPVFEQALKTGQALVAAHRISDAGLEVLTGVDGEAQLIQQTVQRVSRNFAARAAQANARLYSGTLVALALSGLLAALLTTVAIAGRRRAAQAERRALLSSERRFRALVHTASEVVMVTDRAGRITYVTDSVQTLAGYSPSELIGRRPADLLADEERPRARRLAVQLARAGEAEVIAPSQWQLLRPDGAEVIVEVQARNLLTDPDVAGVVITIRDVTERLRAEARLRHQALHDPLTGLANRTLFEDRVGQALHRVARGPRSIAVLYLDVDGFKSINDSLGHHAGDELLRVLAGRIDECLRGADTAARLGGDEFACLLEDLETPEAALTVGRRLINSLAHPLNIAGRAIVVQASIGIAHGSDPAIGAEQLVRNADLAMYQAKAERRGAIALFHDDLLHAARKRLDLREDLREAVARDELFLAYQPLVQLASSAIVSAEALLRWRHPTDGLIGPDRFIPIAEESGMIVGLGRWVLDHALADLTAWSAVAPELRINVNVAPRELAEPDYVAAVQAALARHRVAPDRLILELTESEILDDDETLGRLSALSELGVRLAIDDFGTGQSSLARLQRLPVSQVKLDRSFLATVDHSAQNATLVRSTLELGQALGLEMVAEGIERDAQLQTLRETRHAAAEVPEPLGQGYFFGRPQSAAAIAELLADAPGGAQKPAAATSAA